MPPSTGKITPFNIDDLSLRRNNVALTTSSGSAIEQDDWPINKLTLCMVGNCYEFLSSAAC